MNKIILPFSLMLFASSSAYSQITPVSSGFDSRITSVDYNPYNVILVRTELGASTLIQLEEGETINAPSAGIGMGDASAWGFSVRGNNIFFKPIAKFPDTNLTVVSDVGRTYSFYLVSSKSPHFIINIDYEKEKQSSDYQQRKTFPCNENQKINVHYSKWGDESLSPSYMWDDGRFTCMKFSKNLELPVIYKIDPSGKESLVNFHMENDTLVLHDIANEFRARLGDKVLGLKSDLTKFAGYNEKATTINAKRGLKQ